MRELVAAMASESSKEPQIHWYDAGHAFFDDENLIGTYSPDDAAVAWERTLAFLRSHVS